EIGAALEEHPAVAQAAVVADASGPGGVKRLAGYVVPRSPDAAGADDLAAALRAHPRERLPDYMVPAARVPVERPPPAATGHADGFFDLGGHSLLATRLIGRARAALGAELAIRDLFEAPTVAELAGRAAAGAGARPALTPAADRPAEPPLSSAQRRLWMIEQLAPSAAYNYPLAMRLRGAFAVPAFRPR